MFPHPMARMTLLLLFVCGPAAAAELVPPGALSATFFDAKPITTIDSRGRTAHLTFAPDGTMRRTTASGRESEGTWRLSDEGFCMQVGKAKRESCYIVLKRDDGKFSAVKQSGLPFTWER